MDGCYVFHDRYIGRQIPAIGSQAARRIRQPRELGDDRNSVDDKLGHLVHRDMVARPPKLEGDAVMEMTFALEPLALAKLDHKVNHPLLEHAGADRAFDFITGAVLEDDAVDAGAIQQMGEEQVGRSDTDDSNLSLHKDLLSGKR